MASISGGGITLAIDPVDGGRITSLRAHGREWLARSAPRGAVESFVDAGTGGWDEVAPTVRPCRLPDGTTLRDHGDAWREPWSVLGETADEVTMAVDLATVGVRLERAIRTSPAGLRLEYAASIASELPVPLLWSAHPLFDASGGARIVAVGELTGEYPTRGGMVSWPREPPRAAVKAFASGLSRAAVIHPDDRAVHMRWSLPHVGFYWDGGEFSTTSVLAIEPTTGAGDAAADVLESLPTVVAGRPLRWWIELSL